MATQQGASKRKPIPGGKVGYAVVGLGHISQVAALPGFRNASKNSRLVALVSGDEKKRQELSQRHDVPAYGYEQLDECLAREDVHAVYIGLPNDLHVDYVERAARAGVHVLCEKPMALSEADCRRMIDVCAENDVRLMVAYRLHLEPVNLEVIDRVQSGAIGDLRMFSSTFSFQVREGDIRTRSRRGGGPLWDIGIYCINAARYLFRAEPQEVQAFAATPEGDRRFAEIDGTLAVTLRFPGPRLASFVCSFASAGVDAFRIVGERGDLHLEHAYTYHGTRILTETVEGKIRQEKFKQTDQFGPEFLYFSDCVLQGQEPEPDGYEGLADVRIIEAVNRSVESGQPVRLAPFEPGRRPDKSQKIRKPAVKPPEPIETDAPSQD